MLPCNVTIIAHPRAFVKMLSKNFTHVAHFAKSIPANASFGGNFCSAIFDGVLRLLNGKVFSRRGTVDLVFVIDGTAFALHTVRAKNPLKLGAVCHFCLLLSHFTWRIGTGSSPCKTDACTGSVRIICSSREGADCHRKRCTTACNWGNHGNSRRTRGNNGYRCSCSA